MKYLICIFALALASVAAFESVVPLKDLKVDASTEGRITNGQTARLGQFPYQVGLSLTRSDGSYWCGGSLISATWIATAAHCTVGVTRFTAYFGSTTRGVAEQSVTATNSAFSQHAGYNGNTLANDITLIKISAVKLGANVNIIPLPRRNGSYSTYAGSTAIASGWGRTSDTGSVANSLNYTPLEIITNTLCASTYGSATVNAGTICTSTPSGKSTCQGDSGGPLALDGTLVGITSFVASAGCTSGRPAGFTRTTYFLDWIANTSGISY